MNIPYINSYTVNNLYSVVVLKYYDFHTIRTETTISTLRNIIPSFMFNVTVNSVNHPKHSLHLFTSRKLKFTYLFGMFLKIFVESYFNFYLESYVPFYFLKLHWRHFQPYMFPGKTFLNVKTFLFYILYLLCTISESGKATLQSLLN